MYDKAPLEFASGSNVSILSWLGGGAPAALIQIWGGWRRQRRRSCAEAGSNSLTTRVNSELYLSVVQQCNPAYECFHLRGMQQLT